jgi:hypothetical protein
MGEAIREAIREAVGETIREAIREGHKKDHRRLKTAERSADWTVILEDPGICRRRFHRSSVDTAA